MIHEMKFLVGEFFFVGPHAPNVRWRSLDGDLQVYCGQPLAGTGTVAKQHNYSR